MIKKILSLSPGSSKSVSLYSKDLAQAVPNTSRTAPFHVLLTQGGPYKGYSNSKQFQLALKSVAELLVKAVHEDSDHRMLSDSIRCTHATLMPVQYSSSGFNIATSSLPCPHKMRMRAVSSMVVEYKSHLFKKRLQN